MTFIRTDLYLIPLGNDKEVKALTQAQKKKIKVYLDTQGFIYKGIVKI